MLFYRLYRIPLFGITGSFYQTERFYLSRHEGFPSILVEALACHAACIAVDCPTGPNEIISHNENGLLISTENIPELTKAIDQLYFDDELKTKFRKNAQASVKYLSPKAIAQKWINLIEAK